MSPCNTGLYLPLNPVKHLLQPTLAVFYGSIDRIENAVMPCKRFSVQLMVVTRKHLNMFEQLPHRMAEPHYHIDRLTVAQLQNRYVQSELRGGLHSGEVKWHSIFWELSEFLQREGPLFDLDEGKLAVFSDLDGYFDGGCSLIAVVRLLDVDGNARGRHDSDERSCRLNPSCEVTTFLKVKCDDLALVEDGEGAIDRIEQRQGCDEHSEKNKQELECELHGIGRCVWGLKSYPDIGCDV